MALIFRLKDPVNRTDRQVAFGKPNDDVSCIAFRRSRLAGDSALEVAIVGTPLAASRFLRGDSHGYLRLSGAGGKYWYNQVSLNVRSLVRMNRRSSTGSTLSLVGYQSNRMR